MSFCGNIILSSLMSKKIFAFLIISVLFLINTSNVFAKINVGGTCFLGQEECIDGFSCQPDPLDNRKRSCQPDGGIGVGVSCYPEDPDPARSKCIEGFSCQPDEKRPTTSSCQPDTVGSTFGKIKAPDPIAGFLAKNPTGAGAISQFLSNGVTLIYSIAGIVLIFMLLWGAFDWMTSGGDKEKLAGAQRKIINAIIGIILFALAFAIIRVLGQFTGFTFFAGS